MCGRYGRWSRRRRIEELLGIEPSGLDDFTLLYNITPGVNTWIARAKDGKPALYSSCLWGTSPVLVEGPEEGCEASHAKAETAREKPMFKKLIGERRCLIPANCYYEWKEMPVGKRPSVGGSQPEERRRKPDRAGARIALARGTTSISRRLASLWSVASAAST
jgi:putative SOS response-associated peptidase YedK